jgi:putative MATE family efflux protein
MIVTGIANAVNVALAYGLIYGHWGLPVLGAVGSAWATFVARAVALLLLLRALWTGRNGVTIRGAGRWQPDWHVARQILGLGIPSAVEQILMATAFTVLTILVARLGTDALAAQRIAMSALSASYVPAIGFGIAATTLVGNSIGARRLAEARGAAHVAAFWALGLMCVNCVILLVFSVPLVSIFTSDLDVIRIGATTLLVVGLFLPGDSIGIVLAGALRGTGDTRYPLLVGSSGMWLAVLLAWPALTWFGGGLPVAWAPFVVIVPISSVLIWRQFHRRIRQLQTA